MSDQKTIENWGFYFPGFKAKQFFAEKSSTCLVSASLTSLARSGSSTGSIGVVQNDINELDSC